MHLNVLHLINPKYTDKVKICRSRMFGPYIFSKTEKNIINDSKFSRKVKFAKP